MDRYRAWWDSFVPKMLREEDVVATTPGRKAERYEGWACAGEAMKWTAETLVPLGT